MSMIPSPGPMSPTMTCPRCGRPVGADSRFCNACGAPLPGGSPLGPPTTVAVGAPPPVDIRQRVDDDRGVLKRLQLLIPGYRGYRQGEDVRAADNLLRIQTADKVRNARATMENARSSLSNAGQFAVLNDLAPLMADLQRLEGEVRHAEQGYSGISPSVRINPQQLDRLYEYDYGFVVAADTLNQTIAPLPSLAMGTDASSLPALVATARGQVNQLEQAWKARLEAVEGIRVP
jgi:zinc-ribbon domain